MLLDVKNIILILIIAIPLNVFGAKPFEEQSLDLESDDVTAIDLESDIELLDIPEIKLNQKQTPREKNIKIEDKIKPSSNKPFTPRISGRDIGKACEKAIINMRGGLATRGQGLCYRGVKFCLKNAGLYDKDYLNEYVGSTFTGGDGTQCTSYRQMESAKCAHAPLVNIGMKKLNVQSAKDAPVGSVLVYGGGPHGHIEVVGLDANGQKKYYSDFMTSRPISDYNSDRKLIGVYVP
jgi:hypothetical protein